MSQPTFRPFRTGDLPRLQEIRAAAFAPIFRGFRQDIGGEVAQREFRSADREQAGYLAKATADPDAPGFTVMVLDTQVIGFCGHRLDPATGRGEVDLNAVDPAFQGCGHGTQMYEHVLAQLRQAGATYFKVSTGGDAAHAPARAAYKKVGFANPLPSMCLYMPAG